MIKSIALILALVSTASMAEAATHGPYRKLRPSLAVLDAINAELRERLRPIGNLRISELVVGEEIKNPDYIAFCASVEGTSAKGDAARAPQFFGTFERRKPVLWDMDGPGSNAGSLNCLVFRASLKD